ncbi:hypothetical protein HS088_TW07G00588 [Tripterygium wilfordii]|uniref:Uncharacterized protein n=2 Tax=Tripterygium wilfordii TaxID=458696 RepID=A0A7J7DF76_TRIWF|nr:hypothetical protein HS088_TW07G00588 [Tripterygium wilfordii]
MDSHKPSINAFYDSAPTSPTRSFNNTWFYSLPSSPTRGGSKAIYNVQTEPRIPGAYFEDVSSDFDEFEFETCLRVGLDEDREDSLDDHHQQGKVRRQQGGSLPAMAFADELFCGGKVLPLKPPPRLQYPNGNVSWKNPTSPKSFNSIIKFGSLWNDDFDPFMAALENVKEEKSGKSEQKNYRRAQSLPPILPTTPEHPNGPVCGLKLAEPKGVVYARHARQLAKAEADERPSRPTIEKGGKQSKKKKIMKLIKRNLSMAKTSDEEKDAAAAAAGKKSTKPKLSNKFRSDEPMGLMKYNEDKRKSDHDMTRMAIVQWRPKLFSCMGYAPKYVD